MSPRDGPVPADASVLLDDSARAALLAIARRSLESYVRSGRPYEPDLAALPRCLAVDAPSFVTLVSRGALRGCIGSVLARQPLASDVAHNAVAAAASDPRFPPVAADELDEIRLEVTVLTVPRALPYRDYEDLVAKIRPGVDGVMLTWFGARGLLLPQVWSRVPDPDVFLEHVCLKAGFAPRELRRRPPVVTAWTFQEEHFHEEGYEEPG